MNLPRQNSHGRVLGIDSFLFEEKLSNASRILRLFSVLSQWLVYIPTLVAETHLCYWKILREKAALSFCFLLLLISAFRAFQTPRYALCDLDNTVVNYHSSQTCFFIAWKARKGHEIKSTHPCFWGSKARSLLNLFETKSS